MNGSIMTMRFFYMFAILVSVMTGAIQAASQQAGSELPGVWAEVESGKGHSASQNDPNASGGKRLGWFHKDKSVLIEIQLDEAMPDAMVYLRYSQGDASPGTLDVYLGRVSAAGEPDSSVYRLDRLSLANTGGWDKFKWTAMRVGHLEAGLYRLLLINPTEGAAGDFDIIGIAPTQDRGLWLPPNQVKDGRLHGEGSTSPAVTISDFSSAVVGNIFQSDQLSGGEAGQVSFLIQVRNNVVTEPVDCRVKGHLYNDHGIAMELEAKQFELEPAANEAIEYTFSPPDYGWFGIKLQITSGTISESREGSFCVVHPAAEGVRPESYFGLGIGKSPADMAIGQAIGVKWRRGIPETDTATVAPEPGKWWTESQINVAREQVQKWKDHGILCLGYVNYNPEWNVMPDPLGRKISRHENRPKDLEVQADIVYHLIRPLADLVKHWELWNEPWVHGWTWRTGTAQDYRDMSKLIWDKVKQDMPDVMLIGGGSTPYMRDIVYAKGSRNAGYVDGSSTHPYGPPDRSSLSPPALESYMNANWSKGLGYGGIWATEVGTAEHMFEDLPEEDRKFMVARSVAPIYLLNILGAGESPIKVFFFASQYNAAFSGDTHNMWWGKNPRPAIAAYSAMTHFLEDARLLGDIYAKSKAAWAVHFVKPDGSSVVAYWPEWGYEGRMSIPAKGFTAYDYLGRPIGEVSDGRLTFPIQTWEVRYLVSDRNADEVAKSLRQAQFDNLPALFINPRSFTRPLDKLPPLTVKVENLLPRQCDATIKLETPAEIKLLRDEIKLKKIEPGEIRFIDLKMFLGKANDVNRYTIKYTAEADGVKQEGAQVVQVACATYGRAAIDGKLDDWSDALPVTMFSRGGKDYTRIALNPDLAGKLLGQKQQGDTAAYKIWTRWDDDHFYIAAEVPDSTLSTHSTFEDDPYAFPFLADCLHVAFDCLEKNPDDILYGHPLYEKALAADVDYEFCATLARETGDGSSFSSKPAWEGDLTKQPHIPELHRLKAPGTNYQTLYPTNSPLDPPLGTMQSTPEGGPEGQIMITYDYKEKVLRYEIAIPWTQIGELGEKVKALGEDQFLQTHFAFAVGDAGGRGKTYWTQEAGDVQSGSYGFSPHWGGGNRQNGGRIITDWGFMR